MTDETSEKFRGFFEDAIAAGDTLMGRLRGSMSSFSDKEIEQLADQAAELYSGLPGDPVRHLISEVTADEYGRRFNDPEGAAVSNVVAFPKGHAKTDAAAKIADMAIEAAMVATGFMAEAEDLANDFIANVDAKLTALNPDALEIVGEISADIFAGEVCTLGQSILAEVIDAEFARRRALGRLMGNEEWPSGDGAA